MTIPSRGFCHGIFLLVQAARFRDPPNQRDWVERARSVPAFIAKAVDLEGAAQFLVDTKLCVPNASGDLTVSGRLLQCGRAADTETLSQIAKIVMDVSPPDWLSLGSGPNLLELIPEAVAQQLSWLGDYLAPILSEIGDRLTENDPFRDLLGRLGEKVVVACERNKGRAVRHVALISDSFGYDIESVGTDVLRLEAKASAPGTMHRIYLTKNEASKAVQYGDEWRLVQIIFAPSILARDMPVLPKDILGMRWATGTETARHLLRDTTACKWVQLVELQIPENCWRQYDGSLPINWCDRLA